VSLRVGVDIDGVLADFRTAFRETAKHVSRRPWPDDDAQTPAAGDLTAGELKRAWNAIAKTPQWWLRLQAYERSEIERLFRESRERRWEVYFMTTRPPSAGETPQYQTQHWLEANGFHLPSVLTVPGSRGDLSKSLKLDALIDDRLLNLMDVIGASQTKAIYLMRDNDVAGREQALARGIAVVTTLREAIDALLQLETALQTKGRVARLIDWFRAKPPDERLPLSPRDERPLPPLERE
jgi:hypothetical protein